jgi:nitrite reductase/ring-hydroxylating ferredoxin subunit
MPGTFTVAKVGDLEEGKAKVCQAGGTPVALILCAGTYRALGNVCRHRGGPIGEGHIDTHERTVTCPWHGWQYDVETGQAKLNPMAKLAVYPVEVVGNEIRVTV